MNTRKRNRGGVPVRLSESKLKAIIAESMRKAMNEEASEQYSRREQYSRLYTLLYYKIGDATTGIDDFVGRALMSNELEPQVLQKLIKLRDASDVLQDIAHEVAGHLGWE